MSEKCSFFNSVDGDRLYNADDWASYFATFISNGVFPDPSSQLQVLANGTNMELSVQPGNAFINGYRYAIVDEPYSLTIPEANPTKTRIDRIVVRWSRAARRIYIDILEGEPGAGVPRAVTQDYDTWELALANVTVGASTLVLSQANIEDTRGSADCGIVAWMVGSDGVDYAAFWVQMQTRFNDWVNQCIAQTQGDGDIPTLAGLGVQLSDLCPQTLSGTFSFQGWQGEGDLYTQGILPASLTVVSGSSVIALEDSTEAYIDVDMRNATSSNATDLQDAWALIGRVYVDDTGVHAVCYGESPLIDLPFLLRVVKKK